MGRYYSGDIEGKFWFAVQSSDAADRFGVTGVQPQELYYYFDRDNLDDVEAELKIIKKYLGKNLTKIVKYFKTNASYNDSYIAAYLNVSELYAKSILKHYADYELGMKIRKCILENGQCEFTAEC